MPLGEAVERLRGHDEYPTLFQAAFGRAITTDDLGRALASYVRTILTGGSPFDHYMNGERDALSKQARDGLRIFRGKGNCATCHVAPLFTDERFHNTGVAWEDGVLLDPRSRTLPGDRQGGRSRRVQDTDPARGNPDRPLHA